MVVWLYSPVGLYVGGGALDGRGVESGGVLAVAVVAPAVEDGGGYVDPQTVRLHHGVAEYGVRPLLIRC